MKALGLIEVYGLVTAIEALDAAVKAANVTALGVTQVKGGLVCVQVTGDVGATRAAIDAAAAAAARVGKVIAVHVIPRPAQPIAEMIGPHGPEPVSVPASTPDTPVTAVPIDDLDHLTVVQLRTLARETGIQTLSKRDIRFAKREELLEAIRRFREQGS